MKIIDLTLPIYEGMPIYPGDQEVILEQIPIIEKNGWNMKRIHMNGHDGTHVNAPIHCKINGKTLDDYHIEDFCGNCLIYAGIQDIKPNEGVIFTNQK